TRSCFAILVLFLEFNSFLFEEVEGIVYAGIVCSVKAFEYICLGEIVPEVHPHRTSECRFLFFLIFFRILFLAFQFWWNLEKCWTTIGNKFTDVGIGVKDD